MLSSTQEGRVGQGAPLSDSFEGENDSEGVNEYRNEELGFLVHFPEEKSVLVSGEGIGEDRGRIVFTEEGARGGQISGYIEVELREGRTLTQKKEQVQQGGDVFEPDPEYYPHNTQGFIDVEMEGYPGFIYMPKDGQGFTTTVVLTDERVYTFNLNPAFLDIDGGIERLQRSKDIQAFPADMAYGTFHTLYGFSGMPKTAEVVWGSEFDGCNNLGFYNNHFWYGLIRSRAQVLANEVHSDASPEEFSFCWAENTKTLIGIVPAGHGEWGKVVRYNDETRDFEAASWVIPSGEFEFGMHDFSGKRQGVMIPLVAHGAGDSDACQEKDGLQDGVYYYRYDFISNRVDMIGSKNLCGDGSIVTSYTNY